MTTQKHMTLTQLYKIPQFKHKEASNITEYPNEQMLSFLKREYTSEMETLLTHYPQLSTENNITSSKWKYFKTKDIIFYGEICINNNYPHGRGVITAKDRKYIGYFQKGKAALYGRIMTTKSNKLLYIGEIKNNYKEGYGILYSDNKIVYEGYFNEDCFHGKGKEIDKEGNVWDGFFSKNSKNGKGLYIPIQGKDCMIEYSHNKVIKNDEYKWDVLLILQYEPLLLHMCLNIYAEYEGEHFMLQYDSGKKYVGCIANGKWNGRGVLFEKNSFSIGYFNNNKPQGYFIKIDSKSGYKGNLNGFNIPERNGIYYHANENIWKEKFILTNDTFWMIYYFDNIIIKRKKFKHKNYILEKDGIVYKNNSTFIQEVSFSGISNDFIPYKTIRNDYPLYTIENIEPEYEHIYDLILKFTQLPSTIHTLKWETLHFNKNQKYIGECNDKHIPHGRGCFIDPSEKEKYIIGYICNGKNEGKGCSHTSSMKLYYEGNYHNGKKEGFGILNKDDGSVYYGYFHDNKPYTLGVLVRKESERIEGWFCGEFVTMFSYTIKLNESKIVITHNDNDKKTIINCNDYEYKLKKEIQLEKIKKKYPNQIDKILQLKPTNDSLFLKWDVILSIEECYIGETNQIGFKHGRGISLNPWNKNYYLGYFENNSKEGEGTFFLKNDTKIYHSKFHRDVQCGKGIFYYEDGSTLEGEFNHIGEGTGIKKYSDGHIFEGKFYGWVPSK